MLRAIIIDDEQFSIDALSGYIKLIPYLEIIAVYLDPVEALASVANSDMADIIFMDVDMPNLSGIELAKALRTKTKKLIFTTAYSQYAFNAYEVDGDAFLLKPITLAKFSLTINKLFPPKETISTADKFIGDYFLVKNKDEDLRIVNVAFDDVIAFESANNYVKIYTRDNKTITAYLTLNDVIDIVGKRAEFRQFHRAFVVSTRYISYIEGSVVKLINNMQFNVGDKYRASFDDYINSKLVKTNRKPKLST